MTTPHSPIGGRLVAHRGLAARHIENTLPALRAAVSAGAAFIEVDVQMSSDGLPVLFHDRDLQRLTGYSGTIADHSAATLQTLSLQQKDRPGPQHIPLLAELVPLLQEHPGVRAFIELKRIALAAAGSLQMIDAVIDTLSAVLPQCVFISYDIDAIAAISNRGLPVGLVLEGPLAPQLATAGQLAPGYVFVDIDDISLPLPPMPWTWVVFEVTDPALACSLIKAGNTMVESFDVATLLQNLSQDCLP